MTQAHLFSQKIQEHYAPPNLGQAILSAVTAAGKDPDHLNTGDLAPLDEFHVRGRQATVELAQQLGLEPGQHVLDAGSGLGGASRYLATTYGCQVTGLDLTEAYCQAAEMLAQRLGLSHKVTYQQGSALDMPFEDAAFDVVWTQHAQMNIAEKPQLYYEMARVVKPGGLFAMYDILAGPGGAVHFPVPWARVSEHSFLVSPDGLRVMIEAAGFEILTWRDVTEAGRTFFNQLAAKVRQNGAPPLSFQVFLGADFGAMAANTARNLNENRTILVEAIAKKL